MGLHNGVRNEVGSNLLAAEPTTIETFDGVLGCFYSSKLDIYLALEKMNTKHGLDNHSN